jgi:hypothetical protein
MRPFLFVVENLARLRIHTDFVSGTAALDVEGAMETDAALLSFQFFVGDCSRPSLLSEGAGLFDTTFAPFARFFPRCTRPNDDRSRSLSSEMKLAEGAFDGNSNYVLRPPVVAIPSRELRCTTPEK